MGILETVSTNVLPPSERLEFWNAHASTAITPLEVEPLAGKPFSARLQRCRLRDFEILSPTSSAARLVSRFDDYGPPILNIQIQHRGRSLNHTGGKTSSLSEGDFIVYDPSEPLWMTFDEKIQTIVLRLPIAAVEARVPALRRQVGIPSGGRSGAGELFSTFVRNAWCQIEREKEGNWLDGLSDIIWPLLELAYGSDRRGQCSPRVGERRQMLFQFIEAELSNPNLSVHDLARKAGVSVRIVQMAFAEMGTTPLAYIQNRRLEFAAQRLEKEGMGARITDVAYDVGFNDLSNFSRAFRKRFGTTAALYRRG